MMKDFTTTSFGLLVAYFLPGLLTLYGASPWSESLITLERNIVPRSEVDAAARLVHVKAKETL